MAVTGRGWRGTGVGTGGTSSEQGGREATNRMAPTPKNYVPKIVPRRGRPGIRNPHKH